MIAKSLNADADAYGELVDRYKQAIYRHCFSIVRDEDAAEDMAQETFIAGYYKLSSYKSEYRFSTWLFKIASNKSLNYLKSRRKFVDADDELFDHIVSDHRNTSSQAEDAELHAVIKRLRPEYQTVITMYYFDGIDYQDIAERMGVPIGTVRGWLSRAKNELRKELK